MEINEFIEATNRIEQYFEKEYTNEQRQIMYEELNKMPIEKYKKITSICLKTCKFMPKLADILKASGEMDNTNYDTKRTYTACKICGGKGIIKYKKILEENNYEYDYACRCICDNAEYYSKTIPNFEELGIKPNEKLVMNFK